MVVSAVSPEAMFLGLQLLAITTGIFAGAFRRGRFWLGVIPGALIGLFSPIHTTLGLVGQMVMYGLPGMGR